MKHFGKLAVLGAVLAASASAFATPIALTGGLTVGGVDGVQDTFDNTSITFRTPAGGPPVYNATISGASGNLGFASGSTGVLSNFTLSTTNTNIFTVNDTQGLTFELLSVAVWNDVYTPGLGTSLDIKGFGQFFDTVGDTPESGTFDLSTSGVSCTSQSCNTGANIGFTFQPAAVASSTPEPSSLMLLGTGLIGAAGTFLRKRVTA